MKAPGALCASRAPKRLALLLELGRHLDQLRPLLGPQSERIMLRKRLNLQALFIFAT